MKIIGGVNYYKLYKMLRNIDGEFELSIDQGKTFSGRWNNPQLCEMLLSENPSLKHDVTLIFKDGFKTLCCVQYLRAHNIA